jgi:hypothetical protein
MVSNSLPTCVPDDAMSARSFLQVARRTPDDRSARVPKGEMTRRDLIGAAAATVTASALAPMALPGAAHAADTVETYVLDPTRGGTCTSGGCMACQACQFHAANKLFKSADAAEQSRAHAGCRCSVGTGQSLTQATFDNVFAQGESADRRHTQTAQYLAAEVDQREVPIVGGIVPTAAMAGGIAAVWWYAARRRSADAS